MSVKFNEIKFSYLEVTQFTTWFFASISDDDGFVTDVEFTNAELSYPSAKLISEMFTELKKNLSDINETSLISILDVKEPILGRSETATALSAIRSAILQLESLHKGIPLVEHLGGTYKEAVPLYANINRGLFLTDRTPKSFAKAAEQAANEGFKIIKCAPFDEVNSSQGTSRILDSAQHGINRIKEIRNAIGPDFDVLIDCHGRFNLPAALVMSDVLSELNIAWFEEPLETEEYMDSLIELKANTSIPIAGGESMYGTLSFLEALNSDVLDIVMPDLKYCGGASEAVEIGKMAINLGKGYSPHSPSGPISLLLSGHATAAIEGAMYLEHAVHEYALRNVILTPSELIQDGNLIIPKGIGLGGRLNHEFIEKYGVYFTP